MLGSFVFSIRIIRIFWGSYYLLYECVLVNKADLVFNVFLLILKLLGKDDDKYSAELGKIGKECSTKSKWSLSTVIILLVAKKTFLLFIFLIIKKSKLARNHLFEAI